MKSKKPEVLKVREENDEAPLCFCSFPLFALTSRGNKVMPDEQDRVYPENHHGNNKLLNLLLLLIFTFRMETQ